MNQLNQPTRLAFLLGTATITFAGLFLVFTLFTANGTATTHAQANTTASYRALLEDVIARDTLVIIGFAAPLGVSNETSRMIENARSIELGGDYLCFNERWNNGVRKTCTPFSNVVSLTFAAP